MNNHSLENEHSGNNAELRAYTEGHSTFYVPTVRETFKLGAAPDGSTPYPIQETETCSLVQSRASVTSQDVQQLQQVSNSNNTVCELATSNMHVKRGNIISLYAYVHT